MTSREDVARAMAFFETTDDIVLLHQALGDVVPRARKMVAQLMAKGGEDSIPAPGDLRPARTACTAAEAVAAVRGTNDFALLQLLARGIGQRIESIEIAASADFPEGARVNVPAKPVFPPSGKRVDGVVEESGTVLKVLLDSGETWQGPPSLARRSATEGH